MVKRSRNPNLTTYYKSNFASNSRGSNTRNQQNYYSHRGRARNYTRYNSYRRWERVSSQPISRPISPVEGSEEFMARKIQETSAKIMRHLLSPDEPIALPKTPNKESNKKGLVSEKKNKPKECTDKSHDKTLNKSKKTTTINVKEIREKIMNRLTNLNDGRRKNFINAKNSTNLDNAIQHIAKQKRLELSRVLRDMCSSSYNPQKSGELINSIIPDIGIKLEELPLDVIQELRLTLNLEFDDALSDTAIQENSDIFSVTSDELNNAVNSIQVKIEQNEESNIIDCISSTECTGSVEIKAEDIVECERPDDNELNAEIDPNEAISIITSETNTAVDNDQQHVLDTLQNSFQIKEEPKDDQEEANSIENSFLASTISFSNANENACLEINDTDNHSVNLVGLEINNTDTHRKNLSSQSIFSRNDEFDANCKMSKGFEANSIPDVQNPDKTLENNIRSDSRTDPVFGQDATNNIQRDNRTDLGVRQDASNNIQSDSRIDLGVSQDATNNIRSDRRTNFRVSQDATSQTDSSPDSPEIFFSQFLEDIDVEDLNDASERLEQVDKYINYLSGYRQALVKKILTKCCMRQSDKNREGIGITQSTSVDSGTNKRCFNQSSQTDNIVIEDETSVKRRKVVVSKGDDTLSDNDSLKIKEEIEDDTVVNILKFPGIKDRVVVIERVKSQLVVATEKGNIFFVSLKDGSFMHTIDVTSVPITSVVFLPGLNEFIYMCVGSLDKVLRIYDYNSRELINGTWLDGSITCMDVMWDYVFVGCKCGTLIRYSCKKRKIEYEDKNSSDEILVLKAAQEGPRKVLLIGHKQAPIYVRDAMSGLHLRNFSNEAISPTVYALVLNNNFLYCGTARSNILVFSFHEGSLLHRLYAEPCKGISCMRIYKSLLFSGCYNGSIYVFDLKEKKLLSVLTGPGGSISCMEVLNNQIIVGTLKGQFVSVEIPTTVSSRYSS